MDNPLICSLLGTVRYGDKVRFWVAVGEVAEVAEGFLGDWREVLAWVRGGVRGGRLLQGQPQWRRKVTIVGLAFGFGIGSCAEEGAFEPTAGTVRAACGGGWVSVVSVGGAGSCLEVMVET